MRQYPGAEAVASAIDHPAVLASIKAYEHQIVEVDHNGSINLAALASQITDKTVLISIGYANNEVGTIQPLKEIGFLVREINQNRRKNGIDLPLYLHTNASQAAL